MLRPIDVKEEVPGSHDPRTAPSAVAAYSATPSPAALLEVSEQNNRDLVRQISTGLTDQSFFGRTIHR